MNSHWQLLPKLQFVSFPTLAVIADHQYPADKLMTIMSGKVVLA